MVEPKHGFSWNDKNNIISLRTSKFTITTRILHLICYIQIYYTYENKKLTIIKAVAERNLVGMTKWLKVTVGFQDSNLNPLN